MTSREGMTGIEPALSVWKTEALPLSYIPVPHTTTSYWSSVGKYALIGIAIRCACYTLSRGQIWPGCAQPGCRP